jgi:uncharacterized protein
MIAKKTIKKAIGQLVEAYHPESIYLFGSYAWGTPTDDSDLDLLVVVDHTDQDVYARPIAGHHALWGLGIPKDLIVYTQKEFEQEAKNKTTLCHKIDKAGIKLYAKS